MLAGCLQQLENVGAVCSRRAAELYGLTVMAEGVQDVKDNITRFIVLSRWVLALRCPSSALPHTYGRCT